MKMIDFMGNRNIAIGISTAMVVLSLGIIAVKGIQKNVDFAGGSKLTVLFRESYTKDEDLRKAVDAVEKGASVMTLQSEATKDREFSIKIKNEAEGNTLASDISPERRLKLDQVFSSTAKDEGETLALLQAATVEELAARLLSDNYLLISDSDEVRATRYNQVATDLKAKLGSATTLAALAAQVDAEKAAALNLALLRCYPALNRTTEAQLDGFLTKYNPLARASSANYADIAKQVLAARVANQDFFANYDFLGSLKVAEGESAEALTSFIKKNFSVGNYRIESIENFSASIAAEMLARAWESVLLALVGILLYLWARFSLAYGVAAVVALFHDVIIALGVFSLWGAEFSNPVVAAFLTIVGYSLNDTIVVFDRIREMLGHRKNANVEHVLNVAINNTLSRTVVTSMTTLFVVVVVNFFSGNQTLEAFSFPLLVGITVGTYSSIAIASPILLIWHNNYKPITAE